MTRSLTLETAGEAIAVGSELAWVSELLVEVIGRAPKPRLERPTMTIDIEATQRPFGLSGLTPLTRNAWSGVDETVVQDVCGTGFDLRVKLLAGRPELTFRWRPLWTRRVAQVLLPARFHLLARDVLLHYPVLWWASVQGRAPLHAVACTAGDAVVLLAGPGGVGKSTLLQLELAAGGRATSDNLCVGDGRSVWGLMEPMRVEGSHGRRMPHGRVEVQLEGRVAQLAPDHVVVIHRGYGEVPVLASCDSETAARSLVTGTYVAGELTRFWSFAATLAAGTGVGPSHPQVIEMARAFALRLNCYELHLPRRPGARLADMLSRVEAIA
jgi:hypothetical protein